MLCIHILLLGDIKDILGIYVLPYLFHSNLENFQFAIKVGLK